MWRPACKTLTVLSLFVLVAGCADAPGPVSLDTRGVNPAVDYSPLAGVLDAAVGEDNRLSPRMLEESSETLLRQVKLLAVAGPTVTSELFDSVDAELAYWYNARAAWAMKLALDSGCPRRMDRAELVDRPFPLDGRTMTLADIDDLLEDYDDFRVLAASPGVCMQRAELPRKPFSSEDIRERVAERFERFIDDHDRLRIDVAKRAIYFPPVLWRMRNRITERYENNYGARGAKLSTAILPHVSGDGARRLRNAVGYECVPAVSRWEPALLVED
ncbi:MAG: hypothetical protein ACOC9S_00305 [Planctomycetota bacterium]